MTITKPPSPPDCNSTDDCIEMCTNDHVILGENGVEVHFDNSRGETIRKIHYDGCYCKDGSVLKADFIVGFSKLVDVIVELKGSDLRHAYSQVEHTLARWRNRTN